VERGAPPPALLDDVRRIAVAYGAVERFQLETTLSAITGKHWG
jgi:hypothetical protein